MFFRIGVVLLYKVGSLCVYQLAFPFTGFAQKLYFAGKFPVRHPVVLFGRRICLYQRPGGAVERDPCRRGVAVHSRALTYLRAVTVDILAAVLLVRCSIGSAPLYDLCETSDGVSGNEANGASYCRERRFSLCDSNQLTGAVQLTNATDVVPYHIPRSKREHRQRSAALTCQIAARGQSQLNFGVYRTYGPRCVIFKRTRDQRALIAMQQPGTQGATLAVNEMDYGKDHLRDFATSRSAHWYLCRAQRHFVQRNTATSKSD
jgi:hypothetical protein